MSVTQKKNLICPFCGNKFEATVTHSYNYQEEGCQIAPILTDSWVLQKCPVCHKNFSAVGDLIYHDMDRAIMVFFFPKGQGSLESHLLQVKQVALPEGYTRRVVLESYAAFKEKILIFASGMDDVACEIYKYLMLKNNFSEDNMPAELRFVFSSNLTPKGIAAFSVEGKPLVYRFSNDVYASCKKAAASGNWPDSLVVDQTTVPESFRRNNT